MMRHLFAFALLAGCGGSNAPNDSGVGADDGDSSSASNGGNTYSESSTGTNGGSNGDTIDGGATNVGTDGGKDAQVSSEDAGLLDCASAQGVCFSGSGVRNGKAFSCVGTNFTDVGVSRVLIGTPRWYFTCSNQKDDASLDVAFPVQPPGKVDLMASPGFEYSAVTLSTLGMRMTQESTNLKSAQLVGTVGADMVAIGTLTASWGKPDASCNSGTPGYPCAEGTLKIDFRVPLP